MPRRSIRRRCFVTDGERLVMPAFGAYAGGLNVRDEAFAPLFPDGLTAHLIGETRVFSELTFAQNMDRGVRYPSAVPQIPKTIGDDVENVYQRAFFARLEQKVTAWTTLLFRYQVYTPDKDNGDRHQIDVKVLFNVCEKTWDRFLMGPRNLSAAVRHYCGRELTGAHSAEVDTNATIDVLLAQLARHLARAAPVQERGPRGMVLPIGASLPRTSVGLDDRRPRARLPASEARRVVPLGGRSLERGGARAAQLRPGQRR